MREVSRLRDTLNAPTMFDALLRRARTLYRFRSALNRAYDAPHFRGRLLEWRSFAAIHDLELELGEPLDRSSLSGAYLGMPVTVSLFADEVRVITNFSVKLAAPPPAELLARVHESSLLHEQTERLLDECVLRAKLDDVRSSALRESLHAHTAHLVVSETTLTCHARYVDSVAQHTKILVALFTLTRALQAETPPSSPYRANRG